MHKIFYLTTGSIYGHLFLGITILLGLVWVKVELGIYFSSFNWNLYFSIFLNHLHLITLMISTKKHTISILKLWMVSCCFLLIWNTAVLYFPGRYFPASVFTPCLSYWRRPIFQVNIFPGAVLISHFVVTD